MKKLKILLITILMIVSMTSVSFAAGSPTKKPISIIDSDGNVTNKTGSGNDGGIILAVPGNDDSKHSNNENSQFLANVIEEISSVNFKNETSISGNVDPSTNTTTTTGTINNKLIKIIENEADITGNIDQIIIKAPTAKKDLTFIKPVEENIGLKEINNASAIVITSPDILNNNDAIADITQTALDENRKVFNYTKAVDADGNVIGLIAENKEVIDTNTNEVIGSVADDGTVLDLQGNEIAKSQNVLEISHIIEKAICAIDENHNIQGWYDAEKEAFLNDEGEVIGYLVNNLWQDVDGNVIGGTGHYDRYVENEYVIVDSFDLHYWGNLENKQEPPEEVTIYVEDIYYGDDIIVHHELDDKSIVIEKSEVLADNTVRIYDLKSFSLFSVSKKQKVVYEEELTSVYQPTFDSDSYKAISGTVIFIILVIIAIIVALVIKKNRREKHDN